MDKKAASLNLDQGRSKDGRYERKKSGAGTAVAAGAVGAGLAYGGRLAHHAAKTGGPQKAVQRARDVVRSDADTVRHYAGKAATKAKSAGMAAKKRFGPAAKKMLAGLKGLKK
jgi:hypothetical protein